MYILRKLLQGKLGGKLVLGIKLSFGRFKPRWMRDKTFGRGPTSLCPLVELQHHGRIPPEESAGLKSTYKAHNLNVSGPSALSLAYWLTCIILSAFALPGNRIS